MFSQDTRWLPSGKLSRFLSHAKWSHSPENENDHQDQHLRVDIRRPSWCVYLCLSQLILAAYGNIFALCQHTLWSKTLAPNILTPPTEWVVSVHKPGPVHGPHVVHAGPQTPVQSAALAQGPVLDLPISSAAVAPVLHVPTCFHTRALSSGLWALEIWWREGDGGINCHCSLGSTVGGSHDSTGRCSAHPWASRMKGFESTLTGWAVVLVKRSLLEGIFFPVGV